VDIWADASRSDLALLRRAIRESWAVPVERREAILAAVAQQMKSGNTRIGLAVCRVMLAADECNLEYEKRARLQIRPF
jgi:hypothetical protein